MKCTSILQQKIKQLKSGNEPARNRKPNRIDPTQTESQQIQNKKATPTLIHLVWPKPTSAARIG